MDPKSQKQSIPNQPSSTTPVDSRKCLEKKKLLRCKQWTNPEPENMWISWWASSNRSSSTRPRSTQPPEPKDPFLAPSHTMHGAQTASLHIVHQCPDEIRSGERALRFSRRADGYQGAVEGAVTELKMRSVKAREGKSSACGIALNEVSRMKTTYRG